MLSGMFELAFYYVTQYAIDNVVHNLNNPKETQLPIDDARLEVTADDARLEVTADDARLEVAADDARLEVTADDARSEVVDVAHASDYRGIEDLHALFNPQNPNYNVIHDARKNKPSITEDVQLADLSTMFDTKEGYDYDVHYLETVRATLNGLNAQLEGYRTTLNADETKGSFSKMVDAIKQGDTFKDRMHRSVKDAIVAIDLMDESSSDVKSMLDVAFDVPNVKKKVKFKDLPTTLTQEIANIKATHGFSVDKAQQKHVLALEEFKALAESWIANVSDLRTTSMKIADATIVFFNQVKKGAGFIGGVVLALLTGIAAVGYAAYQKISSALKYGVNKAVDAVIGAMEAIGSFVKSIVKNTLDAVQMVALNKGWYAAQSDRSGLVGNDAKLFRQVFWSAAMGTHMYAETLNERRFAVHKKEIANAGAFLAEISAVQGKNVYAKLDSMTLEERVRLVETRISTLETKKVSLEQMMMTIGPKMSNTTYQACVDVRDQLARDIVTQTKLLNTLLPSTLQRVVSGVRYFTKNTFFAKTPTLQPEISLDTVLQHGTVAKNEPVLVVDADADEFAELPAVVISA